MATFTISWTDLTSERQNEIINSLADQKLEELKGSAELDIEEQPEKYEGKTWEKVVIEKYGLDETCPEGTPDHGKIDLYVMSYAQETVEKYFTALEVIL